MPTTTIYLDGGDLGEIEAEVEFDYEPYEPRTWEEPGCPERVDICNIKAFGGVDITHLFSPRDLREFETRILDGIAEARMEDREPCEEY